MTKGWDERYRALVRGQARGLGPALLRCGLWAASVPYGWGVRWRNRLFDRGWKHAVRAAVPVVSVGNLTVGGTGKTPCVEYVARFYRRLGLRVAVLSRGYGSAHGPNDEALVLEENLPDVPHLQGADRAALAATAVEELESEVLVLDDGFQHRRLARDLDVVLVDATDPWGGGHLLPRGLLREPPRGLRRAGVVVLTRCDQVGAGERARLREAVARFAPGVPLAESRHRPLGLVTAGGAEAGLDLLQGRPAAAFCGLGNPDGFRHTLEQLGAAAVAFRTFPDHHAYTRADVEGLRGWAGQLPAGCVILTTQKDLVKLRLERLGGRDLWALRVQLFVEEGRDVLDRKLHEVMRTRY
jgi:tetraacyldisaccharide 4'-kinase